MQTDATPSVRVIDCPSCGGSVELRAAGFSTHFVCLYCASELDILNGAANLIREHAEAAARLPIPLGSRGVLSGIEWVVIGYLEKNDSWERWSEFLLFNPYHGYRWLVLTASGWSFGTPLMIQPGPPSALDQHFDGAIFRKCFRETACTVEYVLGEFYWRVERGDEVTATGYVSGNRMLSCEKTGDEYEWTLEEWISSATVADAFGVEDTGQFPAIGAAPQPHQPNPHTHFALFSGIVATTGFIAALVLAISLSGGERQSVRLLAGDDAASREAVLGPFTISGRSRPFTIETRGQPGDNTWLDVSYELISLDSEDRRFANQPLEYYYGSDWTEDNRRGTLKLSSLPPGRYELAVEIVRPEDETGDMSGSGGLSGSGGTWVDNGARSMETTARPVQISAGPGGFFWFNLILLFLALFGPFGWAVAKAMSFETARRGEYDYGNGSHD